MEAKTNQLEDHFKQEDPCEEVVEHIQSLGLQVALVVSVGGQSDSVANDEHENKEVEGHGGHDVVSTAVAAISFSSHAGVLLVIHLIQVLNIVS